MNTNPAWSSIKVILSDSNVLGEGEHKIMNLDTSTMYTTIGYDQRTYHVIFGYDSDLILLSLTTHTNHFRIMCKEKKPEPKKIYL
jgi:5'-3' exonuclease